MSAKTRGYQVILLASQLCGGHLTTHAPRPGCSTAQTGTIVVLVVVAAAAYAREITCRVLRRPCVCILVVVASRAAVRLPTVLSQ